MTWGLCPCCGEDRSSGSVILRWSAVFGLVDLCKWDIGFLIWGARRKPQRTAIWECPQLHGGVCECVCTRVVLPKASSALRVESRRGWALEAVGSDAQL